MKFLGPALCALGTALQVPAMLKGYTIGYVGFVFCLLFFVMTLAMTLRY